MYDFKVYIHNAPGSPVVELLLMEPRGNLRILERLAKFLVLKQFEVVQRVRITVQAIMRTKPKYTKQNEETDTTNRAYSRSFQYIRYFK